MKKIFITGINSYIGQAFEREVEVLVKTGQYEIQKGSLQDKGLEDFDFTGVDVVLHVAGIAHADTGNADENTQALYYRVNTSLTEQTALKAKMEGVKQFMFISSMIVYGDSAPCGKEKIVNESTKPEPANFYGDSKLKAEQAITKLADENFIITIIRPPMVYGKGSKGNYPKLAKLAVLLPVFPNIYNHRSMIYVGNLCELIRLLIEQNRGGIFCPQNKEYVSTSELVYQIAEAHHKKIVLTGMFNPAIMICRKFIGYLDKVFGNFVYDKNFSNYEDLPYQIYDFKESIKLTEEK